MAIANAAEDIKSSALADQVRADASKAGISSFSCVLIRDEEIVSSFGTSDGGNQMFQVGFLSRLPALMSLLQLVDAKKIQLDRPVNSYLKRWKIPASAFTKSRQVLVSDLLANTSGISGYKFEGVGLSDYAAGKRPAGIQSIRVTSKPGQKVDYAAANMLLVQAILEDVEGKPFVEIAKSRVFTPLKLTHSTYDQLITHKPGIDLAVGDKPRRAYSELASQGLWSSGNDIATMLVTLMKSARGESRFLKRETAQLLFPQGKKGATFGLNREALSDGYSVYLGGQTPGFSCKIRLLPEDGTGAVVLTNTDMGWGFIDRTIDQGFKSVSLLKLGESAASFEPYHVSGEYAGQEICPVCEYVFLPIVFVWAQQDTDENLIAAAQALQGQLVKLGPKKVKALVVLSNLKGDLEKEKAHAKALADRAQTPNVSFVVVKSPTAGTLRSYRIDRKSKNIVYLVRKRQVQARYTDFVFDKDGVPIIESAVQDLAK